jgi:hypothetical protein
MLIAVSRAILMLHQVILLCLEVLFIQENSSFYVEINNVVNLSVHYRLMNLIHNLATEVEAIDMTRMHIVIHRHVLEANNNVSRVKNVHCGRNGTIYSVKFQLVHCCLNNSRVVPICQTKKLSVVFHQG